VKVKLQAASELRDSIDLFTHTGPADYTRFLQKLMPVFLDLLKGPAVFISTSPEQVSSANGMHQAGPSLLMPSAL
jgi:transformation/transcription domain-associated protein